MPDPATDRVECGGCGPCGSARGEAEIALQRRGARAGFLAWFTNEGGECLRSLYSGAWTHGPRPDFCEARLVGESGAALLGDIELHRRERDWVAHGHDIDPAYAEVVLYVVGRGPRPSALPRNSRGTEPARVIVLPPPGLEAAAPSPIVRLPCHDDVRRGGRAAIEARLDWLVVERLHRKAASLGTVQRPGRSGKASLPNDVANLALMGALGQADNRTAMERLA